MDKWFPSNKRVLVLGVSIIFLIGLLFMFKNFDNSFLYRPSLEENSLSKTISDNDFDNDGLKNWEENLWKTDPNNPDTDGDGTNDNDEILQNRNPLVVGPNDQLKSDVLVKNEILNKNLTTTEKVGRDLISGYLEMKTSGSVDSQNIDIFINSIVENEINEGQIDKYFLSDIQITNNNNLESFQKYSDFFLGILKENTGSEHDMIVLKNAIENNNKKELEKLKTSIVLYKNIQLQMLDMQVPSEIKQNHLNILNLFNKIENNTKNAINVFEDPIKTLISINQYKENEENITDEFAILWNYLKEKGVVIEI
jgi:hypothetical protein